MTTEVLPPIGAVAPGGEAVTRRRPKWLSQHLGTAIVLAVGGYALGHYVGNVLSQGRPYIATAAQSNISIVLALVFGVLGWLLGIGVFNYPLARLAGKRPSKPPRTEGWTRFLRYTTTHKTVGLQYLIAVLFFLFTAGLFAMAIRTELLNPVHHIIGPGTYIAIVGQHGTMMMMMQSSLIVGPLGNWLVPLMIGSRRMAFPRIEAASMWIFSAGYLVIMSAIFLGGFPTGWTGYAPLQTQATVGMDSYLVGFFVVGMGMILAGFNLLVTIISTRAPGMTWSRIPMFVWAMATTSVLLALSTPALELACAVGVFDRTIPTAFFLNVHGGASYLWEDLFWFFGHPEVYIAAIPGFGIVGDILPVFCRKPLFAYRVAAAGMVGVALMSFFVWQHHIFQSGIDPDMRPLFMLTTEIISIPTSFIFLVGMGTLYKARIRFEIPMMFALAMYFNFLLGGLSGVFLSDVPVNVTVHGSFFVLSHFHYTILGGLVFAFFAGFYYWFPKMTGKMMNKTLGKIHFWLAFVFFNLTFFPLFLVGLFDQPRRVFEYPTRLTVLNDFSSIAAFCLGFSFFVFAINFVWSMWIDPRRAPQNPWDANGLEWLTPTPVPWYNFERIPVVLSDPYHYDEPDQVPLADLQPVRIPAYATVGGPNGNGSGSGGVTEGANGHG